MSQDPTAIETMMPHASQSYPWSSERVEEPWLVLKTSTRRHMVCIAFLYLIAAGHAEAAERAPSRSETGSEQPGKQATNRKRLTSRKAHASRKQNQGRSTKPKSSRCDHHRACPHYESVVVANAEATKEDRTSDQTYVQGKTLRHSARSSMLEALAGQAGDVYVNSRGMGIHGIANGASGAIHIRGFGGSPNAQVLVVEDGVPDYQGIFGHPIPDAYVPLLVRDVTVVKGGDSVLYGTNAMGGVIVIRNRWRNHNGLELFNDASYGSFQTMREAAALLGHWNRWDLATSVSFLGTDGHRAGAGGKNFVSQVAGRYRFGSTMSLTTRDRIVHLKGGDPGPASHPYLNHWYDVWRNTSSLRFVLDVHRWRLTFTPYLNVGVHRLYDGFYSTDYVLGHDANASVRLPHGLHAITGAAVEWGDGQVENRIDRTNQMIPGVATFSFYHQLTWHPHPSLDLVAGSRELLSSRYGFVFLFKGGITWRVLRWLRLRSRVTKNFRQPTIRELYLPFPTANPDLKPEYALNWDAGATVILPHVLFSVTGYRSDITNMIKYFGSWPTAEVVNIDQMVIWGVEAKLVLDGLGPMRCFVTGNWQNLGRYTKQNPDAKLNFSLQAHHGFGSHQIAGSLSGEWVHGLYMSNYHRDPIPDVFFLNMRISDRYRPDGATYSFEPYLVIQNLLNRKNAYIKDYPIPGITILAGLALRFE